jgi:hypothetical protein
MSALRSEADIWAGLQRVCFVLTKRFCGLEINDKWKLSGLLNRKLGRLNAFQNSIENDEYPSLRELSRESPLI